MTGNSAGLAQRLFTRRRALYLAGAGTLTASLAACGGSSDPSSDSTSSSDAASSSSGATPDCVLTPEQTEGPFYTDRELIRRDITDGKPGAAVDFRLTVVDADTCAPIPDATVDIWHADATGLYSAFTGQGDSRDVDTTTESFLRGTQPTDADGTAMFTTIYPGWYPGRTTHVHVKVHFADQTRVTSQLYFPDETTAGVYADAAAYIERGAKDTSNDDENMGADLTNLRMALTKVGDKLLATHTLGIERS